MQRYSKKEIAIIKAHLKASAKATGTPLNIRAALDAAGDEIYEELGINRSLAALEMFYYSKLRKQITFFGFQNLKNTRKLKKMKVVPALVELHGRVYQLSLNLTQEAIHSLETSKN